jgi:diguanylate cyclase (GGDEF)-like protein
LNNDKVDVSISPERDVAELLYGNLLSGTLTSIFVASFLVFSFESKHEGGQWFKLLWLSGMMCVLLYRLVDWVWWKKKLYSTEYESYPPLMRVTIGANLTAVMWSIYAIYIVYYSELIEQTAVMIAIVAMAGGGATVFAAHKKTAMFYAFILPAPVSIMLMFNDLDVNQTLGVLGFSFGFVMMIIAAKSANFTKLAIALKNENAVLVNHMEQQVEQRTQKIYELSNLDPLTGLHNRTAFLGNLENRLLAATNNNTSIALLFIDLDGFKKVNDTFGHEVGDVILSESARRLKDKVSDPQLLCRWGGDEFLIALEGVSEAQARVKAGEFIQVLSQEHGIEDGTIISIGATVGLSLFPDHEKLKSRLIQFADTAMYHQKKLRSGLVCMFTPEMGARQQHELKLKNGLNEAIDKEQLRLAFQPIVSSDKAEIVAFEALLRWNFDGENIPPDDFIGIAEQYGLINRIGAWVLKESCLAAVGWQDLKENTAVCINVSVLQLQDADFLGILDDAIISSGIAPSLVYLEITESVFESDTELMLEKIRVIQGKGIKVSIDDFGTGYSSLSAMQDLAVNTVKIDRSFVNRLEDSGYAIVTAVIHAASLLEFDIVAEGVESEAQWKKLAGLGVHKLQGYFFAKPMEAEEVRDFIKLKNT